MERLYKIGEIESDVNNKIERVGKWRSTSWVLYDRRISIKLKGTFIRFAIIPAMLYSTESWAIEKQHVHKMGIMKWEC